MSQALRYVLETRSHAEEVMASKALTVCWMGTDIRTRKISRGGQVWQRTCQQRKQRRLPGGTFTFPPTPLSTCTEPDTQRTLPKCQLLPTAGHIN